MVMYTATFSAVAVAVAMDLFEVVAPATGTVVLHMVELGQTTEVTDAQDEQLQLYWKSGQTTSGTGGTTVTAVPVLFGDTAFGGTVEANNTTKATAGTIVTHQSPVWTVRAGYLFVWTPETRPRLAPSRRGTLELLSAPADAVTMSGTVWFEVV